MTYALAVLGLLCYGSAIYLVCAYFDRKDDK